MSYSSLILKDSPQCVWALEEPSGYAVKADSFMGSSYNGEYLKDGSNVDKFLRSPIPLVYGGKFSIYNNPSASYSSSRVMFNIPSLDVFSMSRKGTAHTLEFWMILEMDEISYPQAAANKIGETKIVGFANSTNPGLYLRDMDYLVFKIGETGYTTFESAVHISSFNEPIHIVISYNINSIQLIVNGIAGPLTPITENVLTASADRKIEFLFPDKINQTSGTPSFSRIAYDSISIYSYAMNTSIAKRHFVYGAGYDVPKNSVKVQGGASYATNMQITKPLKQINYLDKTTWTNSATFSNILLNDYNVSTMNYNNHKLYISSSLAAKSEKDMISTTSDYFYFPQDCFSYIEIDNYESITNGTTKKIEAKFQKGSGTSKEQLMYIGSKSNPQVYLSFEIEGTTVTGYAKSKNGTEESVISKTSITTDFYISIINNNNTISMSIGNSSGTPTSATYSSIDIFPMENSYVRFGSAPVFFGNNVPASVTTSEIKRFTGRLVQVDIYDSSTATASYSAYPTKKISNLYQLYANSSTRSACVATKGTISFTIPLVNLCGANNIGKESNTINMGLKAEIGSMFADGTYTLSKISGAVGSETKAAVSGYENINIRKIHIPKLANGNLVESLQFDCTITLRSSDIFSTPGILDYFRIYTYEGKLDASDKAYVEIVDGVVGDNARYYSGYSSGNLAFTTMPDLGKTSDIFRSFNTGTKVGKSHSSVTPYLMIPFNVRTITSNTGPTIRAIMFSGILGKDETQNTMSLLKYISGATTVEILGSNIEPSGVTTFLNGEPYTSGTTPWNPKVWNHYTFIFNPGIDYINNTTNIYFGASGAEWNIDNINIFTDELFYTGNQSTLVKSMYDKYYGFVSNKYGDGSASYFNLIINDEELSNGKDTYQRILGQDGFVQSSASPRAASTDNLVLTGTSPTFTYTFGTSIDLQKLDGVVLITGDKILLKNQTTTSQNGIYTVTKNATTFTLVKDTNPTNNYVTGVTEGRLNGRKFFKYNSSANTYIETDVQKKVVAYTQINPSIVIQE